jgi:hypothetical protein
MSQHSVGQAVSPANRPQAGSHTSESGFALLLVFLMAAIVAISLYMQIPRVAFQSQRQKEQLLMSRGEQYKRAIQLFVRANNRYPGDIKDLENFNNRRYLRHKFVDPVTGKDEWRLIHVNAAGVFTDSLLNKKKDADKDKKDQQPAGPQFVAEEAGLGSNLNQGQVITNPALNRRASEGGPPTPVGGRIGLDGQPVQYLPPGQGDPTQQTAGAQAQPYPGAPIQGQPYTPIQGMPNPVTGNFGASPTNPGAVVNNGVQANNNSNSGAPVPPEIGNFPNTQRQAFPAQTQGGIAPPGILPGGIQPGVTQPGQQGLPQTNLNQSNLNQSNQANQANNNSSSFVGGGGSFVGGSSFVGSGSSFVGGQTNPTGAAGNNPIPQLNQNFPQPNQPAQVQTPQQFQPPQQQFQPQQAAQPFAVSPQPVTQAGNTTPITGGSNQATQMINNILTSPRTQPTPNGQQGGQQVGGGIAGVASTSESPSIMVYNDRTNYNEWEFIFDLTKQRAAANPNGGVVGTPAQNIGTGIAPTAGAQPGVVNTNASANPQMGLPSIGGFGAQPAQQATNGAPGSTGSGTTPGGQNPAAFGQQQQGGIPPDIRLGRP